MINTGNDSSIKYTFKDVYYDVEYNIVPIIINYDKASIVYNNFYYGFNDKYRTDNIRDVVTIFTSSLKIILNSIVLDSKYIEIIIMLVNYLFDKNFINFNDVKDFIDYNSVEENNIYSERLSISKTPLNFCNYILEMDSIKDLNINKVFKKVFVNRFLYTYDINIYYNYYVCLNSNVDKIDFYLQNINFLNGSILDKKNISTLDFYYTSQYIISQINYTYKSIFDYLDRLISYYSIYDDELKRRTEERKYSLLEERVDHTYIFIDRYNTLRNKTYTDIDFNKNLLSLKYKLLRVLYYNTDNDSDIYNENYKIPDNMNVLYIESSRILFDMDMFKYLNDTGFINTYKINSLL